MRLSKVMARLTSTLLENWVMRQIMVKKIRDVKNAARKEVDGSQESDSASRGLLNTLDIH
jgi:hypothetical protein